MEAALLTKQKPHPIYLIAAISMILFSLVGIAAMTGVLPVSRSHTKPTELSTAPTTSAALVQPVAYTPVPQALIQAPQTQPSQALTHTHDPVASAHTHTVGEPKAVARKVTHTTTAKPVRKQVVRKARNSQYVHNDGYRSERDENLRYARYDNDYRAPADNYRVADSSTYRNADYRRCNDCGRVESVEARATPGEGSGLGAVAGGVAGALLGKQIGKGNGNKAATILGAIGGAYAGHQAERYVRKSETYDVNVRMDDGSYRTVSVNQPNARVGEQVRVVDGVIVSQ